MPDNDKIQLPKGFKLDESIETPNVKLPKGFTLDTEVVKKKVGGEESSLTKSQLDLPDFEKGKAFAEKGFLMQAEGTKAPKTKEKIQPVEGQGLLLNTVSALDKGFYKNFISSPIKGLGTALQGATKKVLGGTGEGFVSNKLIQFGDYLNKTIDELTPQDEEFKGTLTDQVAQAFGQVGSLIATGGIAGAAGKGATLVSQVPKGGAAVTAAKTLGSQLSSPTAVSAGLSMGQAEFDRAKEAGANDDQAFEAFYKNASVGSVLETIPVMQFFKRFNNTTGGSVANYIKTKGVAGITGGIEEMTTEVLQQIYSNKTAKDIYNINQDILDGVGSSGGIGFGVGFVLNAMGANAKILRKQGREQEATVLENQVKQYEDNLENPKVTSGNKVSAKDIVTQGVEVGTQKAVRNLDRDLVNNVITPEQYQEGISFAEKAAQVADKIPPTVIGESRAKSIELLVERNDINQANQNLLQQKQTTDVAYHAGIDQEIKANEERIKKIDSEVYNIAKKPSKEFGTKKYVVDGEEVSKEAFEALQGKPLGTKTVIKAEVAEEVKPTEGEIDINKRNKEYLSAGLVVKKFVAEGENQLLTGEDADFQDNSIEKTISSGIKKGLNKEQIMQMLSANGHVFNAGSDMITINNYVKNRINGTETRPFGEFKKNTRVEAAEVKPTEVKEEPLKENEYYHATDATEIIAPSDKGYKKREGANVVGEGIYFGKDKQHLTDRYGKNAIKAELDIKNPLISNNKYIVVDGREIDVQSLSKEDINFLKQKGYDAIKYEAADRAYSNFDETIVFDKSQIKIKEEVKPTEVKEEVKVYNAKDLKENPKVLEEDKDYYSLTYPKSFVELFTDMVSLKNNGFENAKIGDVINIFKKDYVVGGFIENKKNPNKTSVELIRVDKDGNLLREQDLSKKEQKEGKAKEFEEEEIEVVKAEKLTKLVPVESKSDEDFVDKKIKLIKEQGKPLSEFKVGDKVFWASDWDKRWKQYSEGTIVKAGNDYEIKRFSEHPTSKNYKTFVLSSNTDVMLKPENEAKYTGEEAISKATKAFTTKNGRQKIEYEKGQLIVRDAKTGKEVSLSTRKKALDEYVENFDFSKGKNVEELEIELPTNLNEEEGKIFIADNSFNPLELVVLYSNEAKEMKLSGKEQMIAELGIGTVDQNSFNKEMDRNFKTGGMAFSYFRKGGSTLDDIASEMERHYGVEFTPEDIGNFIINHPRGSDAALREGESRVAQRAAERFKELTGLNLDNTLANKIIDAEMAKAEAFEQEIIKQEYETREQLEADYWKASAEADRLAEKGNRPAVKESEKTQEKELAKEYKEVVGKASKKAKENAKKEFVDRNFDNIVEKLKIQIKCPT